MPSTELFSDCTISFLSRIEANLANQSPHRIADHICDTVTEHDDWRMRQLNMNPAESLMSRRGRALLDSDLATRLTEGFPGDKVYPHGAQNRYIDEIEGIAIALIKKLFGAVYVDWRPINTTTANALVFFGLLRQGDTILVQSENNGGNYSYQSSGPPGLLNSNVLELNWQDETFELSIDSIAAQAREARPKMIVVGGSNVLFPYPIRELREICDEIGAYLLFDAAHLGLHISAGNFQKPLDEGAHVVTVSSHKVMGGPVGGLVLTNDRDIAGKLLNLTFPAFMQTRDLNKYAALAFSLAEIAAYGEKLSSQMISNAQELGLALSDRGFDIIGMNRGATRTHQLFVKLGKNAQKFEKQCQTVGINLSDCALAGDDDKNDRSGARLATHELTRLGMGKPEMIEIAEFIRRAADDDNRCTLASDIREFKDRYQSIPFSFDDKDQRGG